MAHFFAIPLLTFGRPFALLLSCRKQDAIRYVDGTEKENDMIVALDFADRIRALKRLISEGGGGNLVCKLMDNIPSGCGEPHGLKHLDYTLVTCALETIHQPLLTGMCLCEGNWAYGPPVCGNFDGLLHLDFTLVDCTFAYSVLWGDFDAGN